MLRAVPYCDHAVAFQPSPHSGTVCRTCALPTRLCSASSTIVNAPHGGEVDRSGSLVRIARLLYQAKVPREVIITVLAERDVSLGWRKYSERADARRQYERVVDVVSR